MEIVKSIAGLKKDFLEKDVSIWDAWKPNGRLAFKLEVRSTGEVIVTSPEGRLLSVHKSLDHLIADEQDELNALEEFRFGKCLEFQERPTTTRLAPGA